jgi:type VI secretion system protein ImpH
LLQALAGAGPDLVPAAGTPPALLLASCAGLLQQRPRSAAMLVRVLNAYFGVPIALEQNVGYWDRLAPHEQGALGANAVLGDNVLLGERSWRPDLRARLAIGPLDAAAYASFLPHAAAGAALGAILRRCAEPGVHFEVQLILRAQDVQPLQLAAHGSGARLGRDCFLVHGAVGAHRADLRYLLATTP